MQPHHALLAAVAVWLAAPALAADDPPRHPARHAAPRRAAGVPARQSRPAAPDEPVTSPLFPDAAGTEGTAERAAALERRRKAFFAAPAETSPAGAPGAPPVGVTLGGRDGLTPAMGLKF